MRPVGLSAGIANTTPHPHPIGATLNHNSNTAVPQSEFEREGVAALDAQVRLASLISNVMQHPTQKPIALINRAIKNSSKRGGRTGSVRWLGGHYGLGHEDWPARIPDGARPEILRRDREAVGGTHGRDR